MPSSRRVPMVQLWKQVTSGVNGYRIYEADGRFHVTETEIDCRSEYAYADLLDASIFSDRKLEEAEGWLAKQLA